jgi:amino acid permease
MRAASSMLFGGRDGGRALAVHADNPTPAGRRARSHPNRSCAGAGSTAAWLARRSPRATRASKTRASSPPTARPAMSAPGAAPKSTAYGSAPAAAAPAPAAPATTWAGEADAEAGALLRGGSVFSSAMNLAACGLGASMLSLPYAMMVGGPLVTLGMLLLFAVMAFVAGQAVVHAGLRARKSSYAAIVRDAFGAAAGTVAEVLLSVALLVAAVSYICGLSDLIPKLLPWTDAVSRNSRVAAVLAVLFPATLLSSLAALGAVSSVAAAGCYVQALALVFELFHRTGAADTWTVPKMSTLLAVNVSGLVSVSPMVCFVFAYHYLLTETLDELENPTRERMTMVNSSAVCVLVGCYFPLAIAGYLNYSGANVPPNLLTNLVEASAAVVLARLVIAGLLFGTYPLFIIPLRRRVESAAFGRPSTAMTDPARLQVAGGLAAVVACASIALPDLSLANTLAGGCIATVMFFFPGLMMMAQDDMTRRAVGAAVATVGAIVAFVGLFGQVIFDS